MLLHYSLIIFFRHDRLFQDQIHSLHMSLLKRWCLVGSWLNTCSLPTEVIAPVHKVFIELYLL